MSRVAAPPPTRLIRRADLDLVMEVRRSVDVAMEKLHARNPARYHQDRPTLIECSFDPACPFTESATR